MSVTLARTWVVALAAAGVMAGCSDSDSSDRSFDDLDSAGDALFNEALDAGLTDPSTLPTSGSATYDGYMGMTLADEATNPTVLVGDLTMSVEFEGTPTFEGTVDDFVDNRNEEYDGSLQITDGVVFRDVDVEEFYSAEFEVNGTLTNPDGEDMDFDGDGVGDFYGDDQEYMLGDHGGIVTVDGDVIEYGGGFVAER
jgi:hypothetical protein